MTPRRITKRITLADVAREAGVSVQTASHVLADNRTVRLPEQTRQRVRDAAHKVGYRPNRLAQAMKNGKTRMVGVWMPVDRPNISLLQFLQAINSSAHGDNYDLMITGLDGSMAYSGEGRRPHVWPVDGIVSLDAGKAIRAFREDPQNDDIPVAILGLEEYPNSDRVSWDLVEAAREVTNRLIARGCKSIVHVSLDWVLEGFPREQRRRGYTEAMLEAGLEPRFVPVKGESSHPAESAVEEYIQSHGCPDGIFGFTDSLAIGAARAVLNAGRSVPEDCLVWGFGNYPESPDYRIPISTIALPVREVVDQAWAWLLERIERPIEENRLALIPMELIERQSSNRS